MGKSTRTKYWLLRTPKVSSPSAVVMDLERALGESLKRGGMSGNRFETADLGLRETRQAGMQCS
jgi:hypothetical protein